MALTVEDGTGVVGADSYASLSFANAYWANRPHSSSSTTWSGATDVNKEGALREATSYLDAVYGQAYRGYRRGNLQGLQWPRTNALDDAGWPLPDLPMEIQWATVELAVRALGSSLAADADVAGSIKRKREKVGPIEEETEYQFGSSPYKRFGAVESLLEAVTKKRLSWAWL